MKTKRQKKNTNQSKKNHDRKSTLIGDKREYKKIKNTH